MTRREYVLLADDEPLSCEFLEEALLALGCDVHAVGDGDAAIAALEQRAYDLVVTDLKMPGQDGMAVLAASKASDPDRPVILVTAHGTMHVAIDAMRAGAADILEKPLVIDDLQLTLERVTERRRLLRENRFLRAESIGGDMLVASPEMAAVVELVQRVAQSVATVLIRGESGTGKECVAALVHKRSDRADGPFVKLNCAAIPENLLESELFGHEAGAFTGASTRRVGRFELADGGTLFLDEVGEMSAAMQAKLLRVLQESEFERVGGNQTVRVDVRVVAATNRDLQAEVEAGRFRADLLYRLDVVPVQLPALRDRTTDIVPLARHFLGGELELDPAAASALESHSWPGNVRELQNVMQRVGLLCEHGRVTVELVREWLGPRAAAAAADAGAPSAMEHSAMEHSAMEQSAMEQGAMEQSAAEKTVVLEVGDPFQALVGRPLQEIEDELVRRTLAHCGGNRKRTAAMLGIGVRTLFNRLKTATDEPASAETAAATLR